MHVYFCARWYDNGRAHMHANNFFLFLSRSLSFTHTHTHTITHTHTYTHTHTHIQTHTHTHTHAHTHTHTHTHTYTHTNTHIVPGGLIMGAASGVVTPLSSMNVSCALTVTGEFGAYYIGHMHAMTHFYV